MKPRLRPDNKVDIQSAIYFAIEKIIEGKPAYRSCLNCINFRETSGELCGLAMQRPPARIIAYGCPQYEDVDAIPF